MCHPTPTQDFAKSETANYLKYLGFLAEFWRYVYRVYGSGPIRTPTRRIEMEPNPEQPRGDNHATASNLIATIEEATGQLTDALMHISLSLDDVAEALAAEGSE